MRLARSRQRPAFDDIVKRTFGLSARRHQHEIMHRPMYRLIRRYLATSRVTQQRDMRHMRASVEGDAGLLNCGSQRIDQFAELRRRLTWPHPADPVVAPVAELVQRQFECVGLDGIHTGKQSIELRDRGTPEKGQGEMQGVGAHAAAVPVFMQPFAGTVERLTGDVIRPQGEKQAQRIWLGRGGVG